jgi:hypothetical protein
MSPPSSYPIFAFSQRKELIPTARLSSNKRQLFSAGAHSFLFLVSVAVVSAQPAGC